MVGFIKKYFFFFTAMMFFGCNVLSVKPLKCVSMKNQECRVRPEIIIVNSNENSFYPYCIKVNKCSDSCIDINDPYAKLSIPDIFKNINDKLFNLMSRNNEIKRI